MKQLHLNAIKVFIALLNKLADNATCEISAPADGLMPLTIERAEENILTPLGVATIYALYHHYSDRGIKLNDPLMRFLVVDNRQHPTDVNGLAVITYYFRQDNSGAEEESITITDGQVARIKKQWQAGHTLFANDWLTNIRKQGYLK